MAHSITQNMDEKTLGSYLSFLDSEAEKKRHAHENERRIDEHMKMLYERNKSDAFIPWKEMKILRKKQEAKWIQGNTK